MRTPDTQTTANDRARGWALAIGLVVAGAVAAVGIVRCGGSDVEPSAVSHAPIAAPAGSSGSDAQQLSDHAAEREEASASGADLAQSRPEARAPFPYTIAAGDSLWSIAQANGCSVEALQQANALDGDAIYAGQTLVIPPCDAPAAPRAAPAPGASYVIEAGDYLELIAANAGCSVQEVMDANGMEDDAIFAGARILIPACAPLEEETADDGYRIAAGDTLGGIAERFGCSVSELLAVNRLPNADSIRSGDRLRVPEDCTGRPVRYTTVSYAVDTRSLERLMRAEGFSPPPRFKAYVVEITFDDARRTIVGERRFDWRGTSDDDNGWNPASSVKLFAALAAIDFARELGFSNDATLVFHGASGDRIRRLDDLVSRALGPSDNIAYNELVQFVGFDRMHETFLASANGLRRTALRRAYERTRWMEMGEASSFMASPRVTLRERGRTHELSARRGTATTDCGGSACTTLHDLGEAMRRLMLQEQLPAGGHFDLPREDLLTIRRALRAERRRGEEVVDALAEHFDERATLYHKAGFSQDWYSDVVYIGDPYSDQAWIVALAGHPGRDTLTDAADTIGALISSGALRDHR